MSRLAITRADGRSNSQVLLDLLGKGSPGQTYTYGELSAALSEGCPRKFTTVAVQGAVRAALPLLGRIHKRTLDCLHGIGYRLAHASEHLGLAVKCQSKAQRQLKRGIQILRDVRLDEIKDPQARAAHEGHLLITSALLYQGQARDRRVEKLEAAVEALMRPKT